MSLSKYKNKTSKYSEIFDLEWEKNADSWYYNDYYDYYEYWDDEYCDKSCCMADYSIKNRVYATYLYRRGNGVSISDTLIGEFIDMDTIYMIGTIYYRDKMLRRLLGEEKFHTEIVTTLGDYFPKNIGNN